MNDHNPYAPPRSEVEVMDTPARAAPPLWNPNAAASWSLFFTPVFGAILNMKNWQALGETQKAASSRSWAIGSLAYFVVMALVSAFLTKSDGLNRAASIALLITWYYASGKRQQAYVVARFGKDYPRRGWTKPLLLGVAGIVGFIVALGVLGGIIGLLSRA
jgi:hypothetical protein